jgi:TetR/AcrR family transcriptional repressor of nem operon
VQAARTLYSTHGFEGTTLDDIITSSGITKGAFYHYFKSTEALCGELIEGVMRDYQQLSESIEADIEPIEQLRQVVGKLAQLNASGKWVNCRLILRLSGESHESRPQIQHKIRQFWQWYMDFYEGLIAECRLAGQLSTHPDAKTQTRLLMSTMAGAITLQRLTATEPAFAGLAEIIIDSLQSPNP